MVWVPDESVEPAVRLTDEHGVKTIAPEEVEDERSQRTRNRLGSVLAIFLGVSLQRLVEVGHDRLIEYVWAFVPQMLERVIDGVIVAAVAVLMLETPMLRNYLEIRLKRYLSLQVRTDFTSRVLDAKFLRSFTPAFRDRAEQALRRASLAPSLPAEVSAFHGALQQASKTLVVWRTNYREKIVLGDVPDHADLMSVTSETDWTFVNYGTGTETFTQVLSELAYALEGHSGTDLYRIEELTIGGVDWKHLTPVEDPDGDHFVQFTTTVPGVEIPPTVSPGDGVAFHSKIVFLKQRAMPHTVRFYRSVHKMELTLFALPQVAPSLNVFGVGGSNPDGDIAPLKPSWRQGQVFNWKYDGWFMPNHGWILLLGTNPPATLTPNKGSAKIPPPGQSLLPPAPDQPKLPSGDHVS